MNVPYSHSAFGHVLQRKSATWGLIEEICQTLEPTDTQYDQAKTSYETVGDWLSASDNPRAEKTFAVWPRLERARHDHSPDRP